MTSTILQPGTVVAGQYRIDRLIGSGGFARIYRAEEVGLGRLVALKVLSTTVDGKLEVGDPVRERFMREAQLISRLQDPRTITIYGYDSTDDGLLYMALEYVDGVDLRVLLDREGPLTSERIEGLAVQVLKGLREAHQLDCLHRDIKPSNIMVYNRFGEPDCVKLLDFGIAKAVLAEHKMGEDLTREGGVIGTPGYMSPEQLMGRPLTAASDIFSLGVVIYEMYSGRSPYPSRDPTEIYRRMQSLAHDLGELESAPERLRETCRRMLRFDADERPDGADEVLSMLGATTGPTSGPSLAALPYAGDPGDATVVNGFDSEGPRTILDDQIEPVLRTRPISSFPLGLDPAGRTPSTELTSVDDGRSEEPDLAATIRHRRSSPQGTMVPTPTAEAAAPRVEPVTLSQSHELFGPSRPAWPIVVIAASFIASLAAVGFYLYVADERESADVPGATAVRTETGSSASTVPDSEPGNGDGDARPAAGTGLLEAAVIARERVGAAVFLGARESEREASSIAERARQLSKPKSRTKKTNRKVRDVSKRDEQEKPTFEIEAFE